MDIDENQFKLYFRMAKNFAFNLPDEKDRVKASKWIRKLEETTDANAKRTKFHVIQLLLLSLQRKELAGPFEKEPLEDTNLTSYNWSFQPSDIARLILRKEFERIGQPDVHVEMSGDLSEFVSFQEIPNFGTHFFYAFSPEQIQKWNNLDKDIIPKGLLNITTISSPDTSILRNAVMETLIRRGKDKYSPEYIKLKDNLKTDLYSTAIDPCCTISPKQTPENRREINEPETTGKKLFNKTMAAIELQEDRIARNKRSMLAKLPSRLKERLTKKFVSKDKQICPDRDPNLARTPEIFRKDANTIKHFRKYKPEEFLLPKDEKFRPAYEAFRDLKYLAPENARRSPNPKLVAKPYTFQPEEDKTGVQDLDESDNVKDSFERSFKRMQNERVPPEPRTRPVRNELIERLKELKASQAQRVVFDDMDIDIETEEIAFDRFVWKELPEEDAEVTLLDNTEMLYDDIFGDDQICDVNVLPSARPIQELEQAEILLDSEMQLDDMFGEDQIKNPEAVFKDVSIEGERVVMANSGFPEKGAYRIGKRLMALPGEEPLVQTYVEQTGNVKLFNESLLRNQDNTPPLDDSMINKILDEKLKKFRQGENAIPRTYGPWATKFLNQIEKLERGEDIEEEQPLQRSYLSDNEMDTNNLFNERHTNMQGGFPSPIIQEQSRRATKKMEAMKNQYEKLKSKQKKQFVDQDLLEPYIYGPVPPNKLGLLDTSIKDNEKLVPPLLKKICVCEKDPFESFEKQMDQSLQFFNEEDSNQSTNVRQGQSILFDSDFLNRRINGNLPADDSIMAEDEMVFDDLFDVAEYTPVKHKFKQYDDKKTYSQTNTGGMQKMLEKPSSQSDLLSASQILPSAAGLSPGQRVRQTLDIVNKYRYNRSNNLPPSYEIPYTQLENESFPLSSESESLDITPKSDLDIWDTAKMDEIEKRLDALRQRDARHQIPRLPIEHDTPTREIIKKSQHVTEDVAKLRNRYQIFQKQQEKLIKQQDNTYCGTFQRPLPVLDKGVPGSTQSEIEDIDDLFNFSEKAESNVSADTSQIYDPTIKRYIPAQNLQDISMPEADFAGDEILQPQLAYQSDNLPEKGEFESTSPIYQPQQRTETPRIMSDIDNRRTLTSDQAQRAQRYQETPRNIPETGARRRLVYEMTSQTECPRLPLNMSPRERIKLLIEQQPDVEVTVKPKKSEFSPTQFITKHVPKKPYQLESESFPDDYHEEYMYENLGDLAHALYIPTEAEERDNEEFQKNRKMIPTPPGPQCAPSQRKQNWPDAIPIGRSDVLPHEEGFKWLPNYMPFEQQVGVGRLKRQTQSRQEQPQARQEQPQARHEKAQARQEQPQEYRQQQSQRQIDQNRRVINQAPDVRQVRRQAAKATASRVSANQTQGPQQTRIRQRQQDDPQSRRPGLKLPTTAKVDIINEKQKNKETIMRKSETVTKKIQPPNREPPKFAPKKKLEYKPSRNIGETKMSTQTRKVTSGAVGQGRKSIVVKSSQSVIKDLDKKSQKIVKANEVKYNNAKEQRTKEYTFASKKRQP